MKAYQYKIKEDLIKILMCFFVALSFVGCDSEEDIKDDPYAGGKEPYGIKLLIDPPSPDKAYPGELVTYKAKGLSKWFNQEGKPDFNFFIANEQAEIILATDTTITVKVPESLSSGIAHILLKEQLFYGPKLTVLGNVNVDKGYIVQKRIPGAIYSYLEHFQPQTKDHYHLVGSFRPITLEDAEIRCIAWIDNKGNVAGGWNNTYYKIDSNQGIGLDFNNPNTDDSKYEYYAKSISYFNKDKVGSNPTVLISGKFTKYYPVQREQPISVNNMMKVEHNIGMMYDDKQLPSIISGQMSSTRITRFNGGTKEAPVATFITSDDKVIAVGNITQYCKVDVDRSYAEDLAYEFTPVKTVLRMDNVGVLDENYRQGKEGVNGVIQDAYMDEQEGVIMVGAINSFDGVSVNNIVRIDKDGNVDQQYLQNIGTGANGTVTKVRYNKQRKKAMLTGMFTEFNGTPCSGIVMLNHDGTVDPVFKLRKMEGGTPNFAVILNNHDVIVMSGTFTKYDGVTRQGFLILTMEGEAMQKFNVPGLFLGELNHVIETKTSTNDNGLLLLGDFYRFNGERAENILKIEVDFD